MVIWFPGFKANQGKTPIAHEHRFQRISEPQRVKVEGGGST